MSRFPMPYDNTGVTIELRQVIESGIDIWAFDYPSFYKGEDKKAFEQKVIDRYLFRQIGQETPARWLHYFRSRIREIMPYYIQLYQSVELMASVEDPFKAYDLTETYTETNENTGKTTGSSSGSKQTTGNDTDKRKFSDTPQGDVENIDSYLTDYTENEKTLSGSESGSESSETNSESSGERSYTLTRQGNIGVQPLGQEIEAYRKALINVDKMVIDELNDLFLQVY